MKIELRNVKSAAFASEETACFSATVVIDGRPAGTVRNDGRGGADMYQPNPLCERLNAYAKTLPPFVSGGESYTHNAETVVGDLLDEYLLKRAYKRLVASRVLIVRADGKIYQSNKLSKEQLVARVLATKSLMNITNNDVKHCLNAMPDDEGFALYKTLAKVTVA